MSTRGIFGLRKNNVDKVTVKSHDSYPGYLGVEIIKALNETSIEKLNEAFDRIKIVGYEYRLRQEDIDKYRKYLNRPVKVSDEMDGKLIELCLKPYITDLDIMLIDESFICDSLFCQYGYIINLDNNTFELWVGIQRKAQEGNRYGEKYNYGGYFPCKLLFTIPLEEAIAMSTYKFLILCANHGL